jgi:hypothetical protein
VFCHLDLSEDYGWRICVEPVLNIFMDELSERLARRWSVPDHDISDMALMQAQEIYELRVFEIEQELMVEL